MSFRRFIDETRITQLAKLIFNHSIGLAFFNFLYKSSQESQAPEITISESQESGTPERTTKREVTDLRILFLF